jgi:release factor glutamine methyltransferase
LIYRNWVTRHASFDTATFGGLLDQVRQFWTPLADKPEETPETLLCALWRAATGAPVSVDRAVKAGLPCLDDTAARRLCDLLERKKAGVPLAHLTQRQCFMGVEFVAGPQALIPRKETEILGRAALAKLHCMAQARGELVVLDVCTGSGNLALAYTYYEPRARVYASDLCADAVKLAERNRAHLGLEDRVELRQGDLLQPFEQEQFLGKVDLLSCNPPYISAAKVSGMHPEISRHEPQTAFNGGVYGVSVLMKLIKNAPRFLRAGAWLGFEVGLGQGAGIARQLERNPAFAAIETYRDSAGDIRAIFTRTRHEAQEGIQAAPRRG